MSAKKISALAVSMTVLSLMLVLIISGVSGHLKSGICADTEKAEVNAIQFGDIDSVTVYSRGTVNDGYSLSLDSAAVYGEPAVVSPIYEAIVSGLRAEEKEIFFDGLSATREEVKDAFTDALNSNPDLFYVGKTYSIGSYDSFATIAYITPSYKATGEALLTMKAEYETMISDILSEVSSSWSDFEKVLFVHDYMVRSFEYDYSYTVYDAYSFLKHEKGVCQAYTLLCIDLLERLDINVGAVPSTSMNHIWNCVELDGKWYHMDITWSDASAPGDHDRFDLIDYDNFLCGDSAISATGHSDWSSDLTFSDDMDDLFLKTVSSQIDVSPLGDDWYVLVKGTEGSSVGISICLADFDANTYESVAFIKEKWYVWGDSGRYYTDIFAGIGRYHDAIVISAPKALYAYSPSAGVVKLGDYSYADGYIYGMNVSEGMAKLRIATDVNNYSGDNFVTVDLTKITFALSVSYKDTLGRDVADAHTVNVGWGAPFEAGVPDFEGYIISAEGLSGLMPLGGYSETLVYTALRTLRIEYVYKDGSEAHSTYIDTQVGLGEEYSVVSPEIDGYFPSAEKVEGVMTDSGVTVTVVYSQSRASLKIIYLYSDGRTAAEPYTADGLAYMADYSVISPEIAGYSPSASVVSGKITEDTEIEVIYSLKKCKVTVNYLYPDGSVADTVEIVLDWGSDYEIVSPSVKGHTAENPSVSGRIEEDSVTLTVGYTRNSYTLTVEYVYNDGASAGATFTARLEYGEQYSVSAPHIEHYLPDRDVIDGTMPDSDILITVVYSSVKYKVEFIVDGEVFFSYEAIYGEQIRLPEADPEKAPSPQKTYAFNSWDGYAEKMTVISDISFNAVFSESARRYKVTFKNHDGTVLQECEVEYGGTAVYNGKEPEHLPIVGMTYTFVGWDGDTEYVTQDSIFTAMFSDGMTVYTIWFFDADGTLLKEEKVYHGHSATPPKNPTKPSDNTYSYVFDGWSGKYKRVSADAAIIATYKAVYIEYSAIFKNENGSVIYEQKYHFGDSMIPPADPVRESDAGYDYVFEKWTPELAEKITENVEYTAIFEKISKFDFTHEDLELALGEIRLATTLEDRFAAISAALLIRNNIYAEAPEAADAVAALDREIEKYNSDIAKLNAQFAESNESVLSFHGYDTVYMSALALIWAIIKKLLVLK